MEIDNRILVQRLHPLAVMPTRETPDSAGLDLYSYTEVRIPAGESVRVPIGISTALPPGTYGRIASRSSMAGKGIEVGAGVVDRDYRGEIQVLLRNLNRAELPNIFTLPPRTKIAQMVIERCDLSNPILVDHLPPTERHHMAFGEPTSPYPSPSLLAPFGL